jgi:cell division protein ZapB
MEELLHRLEKRIQSLVEQHDRLKDTNLQLNQGKSILVREKDALLARQQKAISQIETLVSKLKAIENQS